MKFFVNAMLCLGYMKTGTKCCDQRWLMLSGKLMCIVDSIHHNFKFSISMKAATVNDKNYVKEKLSGLLANVATILHIICIEVLKKAINQTFVEKIY